MEMRAAAHSRSKKPGDTIKKGEELGWFQYGGSTVVVVVPTSCGIQFDKDLLETSEKAMETLVRTLWVVADSRSGLVCRSVGFSDGLVSSAHPSDHGNWFPPTIGRQPCWFSVTLHAE